MSVQSISSSVIRIEIAIPKNKNTHPKIEELRKYIYTIFGGITNSQIHTPLGFPSIFEGLWIDSHGNLWKEDVVLFIIYYDPENKELPEPKAMECLNNFANLLLETGEEATWLILHEGTGLLYDKKISYL